LSLLVALPQSFFFLFFLFVVEVEVCRSLMSSRTRAVALSDRNAANCATETSVGPAPVRAMPLAMPARSGRRGITATPRPARAVPRGVFCQLS